MEKCVENKRRYKYFTRESCVGDKDDNNKNSR